MADYLGMGEQTAFGQQLLNQQQQAQQINLIGAQAKHQLATTDYVAAMAREAQFRGDNAELEFDVTQKLKSLAEVAGEDGEEIDPMTRLTKDANLYIKAGALKKGTELLKAASQITSQQSNAASQAIAARANAQRTRNATLEKYAKMLGGVEDQEGWDQIKETIVAADPNAAPMMEKIGPYSPAKARAYSDALTSMKDKVWAEETKRRNDIYEGIKKSEATRQAELSRVRQEELQLKRERENRLAKNDGRNGKGASAKPAGMPTKAEVESVEDAFEEMDIEGSDSDVQDVAQEARELWKANPGLTQNAAISQVLQKRITDGDIKPGTVEPGKLWGTNKKKGEVLFSPNRPVQLPKDPKGWIKGQYYSTPQGIVKYVDGVNDIVVRPK